MPYPHDHPLRGEVYWVDYSPARGSEQDGRRPAVIISIDSFNATMPVVVTAAITTSVRPGSPVALELPEGSPCERRSSILAFQITTLAKERLDEYVGRLTPDQLVDLNTRIVRSFGLDGA